MIDPYGLGVPVAGAYALENTNRIRTGEPLAWLEGWDIPGVSFDHGQDTRSPAVVGWL